MNINITFFLLIVFIALLLSMAISFLSYFLSNNTPYNEKTSVYECGFTPFSSPSAPFSINFFLVAVIFLIFDLEIILLFPWSTTLTLLTLFSQMIVIVFLLMVIVGLVYEWYNGALEW